MNAGCDVSIIIVNYNGKRYIDDLFCALGKLKHSDFSFEILFVDNASSDDSIIYLKNKYANAFPNLVIISSTENLGFAGGNNLGVAHAHGDYIALLNNDTKPDPDWLEKLFHFFLKKPNIVMANSKLVFFHDYIKVSFSSQEKVIVDRKITINGKPYIIDEKFCLNALCKGDRIECSEGTIIYVPLLNEGEGHSFIFSIIKGNENAYLIHGSIKLPMLSGKSIVLSISPEQEKLNRITLIQNAGSSINKYFDGFNIGFCEEDGERYQEEYEIECACGGAVLFRKRDFIDCGGFDERFFMYYEDTDLSFRMKKKGKILYCPDAIVRHVHAGSSGEWSSFFTYHVSKNKLLFIAKNYGKRIFLKYYFRQILSAIKHRKLSRFMGSQKALWIVVVKGINN